MSKNLYWSIADGKYIPILKTSVKSCRKVEDNTDFLCLTPNSEEFIGAKNLAIGNFSKNNYMFKFHLLNQIRNLDYDWFIFVDTDNYFVRKPNLDLTTLSYGSPIVSILESKCTNTERKDWWGVPLEEYSNYCRKRGVISKDIYNVNAGFFAVKKAFIPQFYTQTVDFFNLVSKDYPNITEEIPLAYITMLMQPNCEKFNIRNNPLLWGSDWTGVFKNKLPVDSHWMFTDYMNGEPVMINPSIVHAMRSKEIMREVSS